MADAGLPVPPNVERIDLAFAPGRPGFLDVVAAVLSELRVEAYVVADESRSACPEIIARLDEALRGIECLWVSHDELKHRCEAARAVVRTGEFTPYANVILRHRRRFLRRPRRSGRLTLERQPRLGETGRSGPRLSGSFGVVEQRRGVIVEGVTLWVGR